MTERSQSPDVALRVRVTGRVQGVWYRGWAAAEARARGLRGWVRNEPDGSVAALVSGPEPAVAGMVAAMWSGPEAARVAAVEVAPTPPPDGEGFSVLR